MNFICTYSTLLKNFSFADFLLIEDNEQGTLRKEPVITLFIERFKTTSFRESNW